MFPSLVVTLHPERDSALRRAIARLAEQGLAIHDISVVPHADIAAMYRQSGALIFPSTVESFGNPLFEAREAGLPILAPERDYVRDVCVSAATFDPIRQAPSHAPCCAF